MRKLVLLVLALALFAFAAPAGAASFWSEQFNYSSGALTAVTPNWTTHSGTGGGATDIQVTAGGVAAGNMANSPDDNRLFGVTQSATAKTYACFQVMVPTPASTPVLNYFAHFKDASTFNFAARVYVAPSGASFTFGLSVGSCASPCVVATWPVALNYNQLYTVAIMYDAAAGSAKLWVDPAGEGSLSISHNTWSGTTSQAGFQLTSFALRQSSSGLPSGTSNWTYNVDNIQVGDAFADLCPSPTGARGSSWGRLKTLYR
jgi:hypothetical protein